jgi:hypothetical protein
MTVPAIYLPDFTSFNCILQLSVVSFRSFQTEVLIPQYATRQVGLGFDKQQNVAVESGIAGRA